MKVSIIISSYNEKECLIQAIKSCLAQDYQGVYEIIISDDGSTDGSIETIKKYAELYPEKIKCIFDKRDDGIEFMEYRESNCRERGIKVSSGDYLMILDGDDLIAPNKLRLQADFLDNNPKYIACYSDFEWFWEDGRQIFTKYNYPEINSVLLWSKVYIHLSAFLFRRSVISNFVPRHITDCMAVRSILKSGKTYHLPAITFRYRQRNNSLWHSYYESEKSIVEINVLQAAIDSNWYYCSSLSRFFHTITRVYANRNKLAIQKYQRFFCYISDHDDHLLSVIRYCEKRTISQKIKLKSIRIQSFFCWFFFSSVIRIFEMLNRKPISTTESNDKI